MGFDPITWALIGGMGYMGYQASQKKPSTPSPGAPPTPAEGMIEGTEKKVRKYRPAAQMFRDEDLRLGVAGRLGRVGG